MNNDIRMYVVLAAFATFIAWKEIIPRVRKWQEERSRRAAPGMEDHMKLMAGHIKAAEEIAKQVALLRTAVIDFTEAIKPRDVGVAASHKFDPDLDSIGNPNRADDDRVADVFAHMLQTGASHEEAQEKVRGEEEKKTMISAVSLGPGNGDMLT